MTNKHYCNQFLLACTCLLASACSHDLKNTETGQAFIRQMVAKHHYDESKLQAVLDSAEIKPDIIKRISSPAEALPWYKYRKIFLTEKRINQGVQFWRANAKALQAAEQQYGVPAEIIVAIIGVESSYGQHTGRYRVIDALATLGFAYPPRSPFFLGELENFLLLCQDEHLDPLQPTGSYAGAMGMPQFMPSSFRNFASDFEGDGRRDIWHNPGDVIFSVANYFAKHHWQPGAAIAITVTAEDESYKKILNNDLKPSLTVHDLETLKITFPTPFPANSKVKLLAFEQETGHHLIASLNNFYVITRYNHSPLYALAVFQLSQAISIQKSLIPL